MTVQTEPKVLSDAVAHEYEERMAFCREKRTAKNAEVLNIGDIFQLEIVDVDEIQTCSVFTGTGSSGTYTLTFYDAHDKIMRTTAGIADAANIATIQAAIDLAASGGTSGIVVGGTIESTSWTFTYSGTAYSGVDVPLITCDFSSWTGVSAVTFVETTKGSLTTQKAILCVDAEKVAGICCENLGTLAADTVATFIERGPAILVQEQLGYNSLDATRVNLNLQKLGILVYNEAATLAIQTT